MKNRKINEMQRKLTYKRYKATIEQLQQAVADEKRNSANLVKDTQKYKFISEETSKDLKVALEAKRAAEEGLEKEKENNKILQDKLALSSTNVKSNEQSQTDSKRWEGERRFLKERIQQLEAQITKLETERKQFKEKAEKLAEKMEEKRGVADDADELSGRLQELEEQMEEEGRSLRSKIDELELEKRLTKQKIDEQEREIANLTDEVEDSRKLIKKQQQELEVERKGLKQKAEEMETDKKTLKRKMEEHMEHEYKGFKEKLSVIDTERKTLKQKLEIQESEKRQLEKKIDSLSDAKLGLEQQVERMEEDDKEKVAELEAENRLLKDKLEIQKANLTKRPDSGVANADNERKLKEKVEELEVERRGLKEKVERIEASRKAIKEQAEAERKSLMERMEAIEHEKRTLKEKGERAEMDKLGLKERLELLESEKRSLRDRVENEKKGWKDKWDDVDGERKTMREKIAGLEEEKKLLKARIEELEEGRERLVESLEAERTSRLLAGSGSRSRQENAVELKASSSSFGANSGEWTDKIEKKRLKNKKLKTQLENTRRQFQQERIMLDSVINDLKEERAKIATELEKAKDKIFGYKRTNTQWESEKSQLIMKLSQQENTSRNTSKRDILVMERDEALSELNALKAKMEDKKAKMSHLEQECASLRDSKEELHDMQHHAKALTQRIEELRRQHVEETTRLESENKRIADKLSEKMDIIDKLVSQIMEKEKSVSHIFSQNVGLSREAEILKQQLEEAQQENDHNAVLSRAGLSPTKWGDGMSQAKWGVRRSNAYEGTASRSMLEKEKDDKDRMISELRSEVRRVKDKYHALKTYPPPSSSHYSPSRHHSSSRKAKRLSSHYHTNPMVVSDAEGNVVMDPEHLARTVEELQEKVKKIKRHLPDYL